MKLTCRTRIAAALAALALCAAPCGMALAQTAGQTSQGTAAGSTVGNGQHHAQKPGGTTGTAQNGTAAKKPEKLITPQQAKELFRSVDKIMKFDSRVSGLAIKHKVKRKLTSREAVKKYLEKKMKNGKDAREMLRSQVELKKFGLLPRDFDLGPFMVKLLKEQIAGYYDPKTKTVYLLNWVAPEEQKPVLAHELMHALQDQYVNLRKWDDQSPDGLSHNVKQDNRHIRLDEVDTARRAVLEGQAMVTYVDYALAPHGISISNAPDLILEHLDQAMSDSHDSPVMRNAPRVLRESLIFPYRAGLRFEIMLLRDEGRKAAFAGALNHPPSSTYQVMTPRAYEAHVKVPILKMPNVHPLLRHNYRPYDVGVMGELDVRMLLQLTTSDHAASRIASQWDGGIYYVAQKRHAANKKSTASIALFYLSHWKTHGAAVLFAKNYDAEVKNKYPDETLSPSSTANEQVYKTGEGPVLVKVSGRYVFVSESFPLKTARTLDFMLMAAQHALKGEQMAACHPPLHHLTSGLRQFVARAGMLRAELPAADVLPPEKPHGHGIYTGISMKSH